jgi:hypothetical protein
LGSRERMVNALQATARWSFALFWLATVASPLRTLFGPTFKPLAQYARDGVLNKARFWQRVAQQSLNARQALVPNKLLDGFEGKLTTSKWAKLAKSSQDTAYRDILDLVKRGILRKDPGGGRSTSYSLVPAS